MVILLESSKVFILYEVNDLVLCQVNTVVEVTAPEQVVMMPHLPTLVTTIIIQVNSEAERNR